MRKSFPDPEARQAYMDTIAYKALLHPKVSEAEAVSAAQIVAEKGAEIEIDPGDRDSAFRND